MSAGYTCTDLFMCRCYCSIAHVWIYNPKCSMHMCNTLRTVQHFLLSLAVVQVLVRVGAVKAITNILDRIGIQYETFDGVEPNPTIEQVILLQPQPKQGRSNAANKWMYHAPLVLLGSQRLLLL